MQNNEKINYRLVALDMDGTLLNSDHVTTPYTREVIRRVGEMGKVAAISTGRCLAELWDHIEKIPGIRYIICENGACVYDTVEKRMVHQISLSHEQVIAVFETVRAVDVKLQYFRNNESVMQYKDPTEFKKYLIDDFAAVFIATAEFTEDLEAHYLEKKGSIEKFNIYCTCEEDKQDVWKKISEHIPGLILSDSIGTGIEVSPEGATKGKGLEKLCEHLNLPIEETIAVGDASNDIEIIRAAGLSVAMGNATDEVKGYADVITDDCDHDGAAKAIQRYMFGENV